MPWLCPAEYHGTLKKITYYVHIPKVLFNPQFYHFLLFSVKVSHTRGCVTFPFISFSTIKMKEKIKAPSSSFPAVLLLCGVKLVGIWKRKEKKRSSYILCQTLDLHMYFQSCNRPIILLTMVMLCANHCWVSLISPLRARVLSEIFSWTTGVAAKLNRYISTGIAEVKPRSKCFSLESHLFKHHLSIYNLWISGLLNWYK